MVVPMRPTWGKNYSSAGLKWPLEICSPNSCSKQDCCQPYINMRVIKRRKENHSHHQTKLKSCMQDLIHRKNTFILNKIPLQEQGGRERKTWVCAQTCLEDKDNKTTIKFASQFMGEQWPQGMTEKLLLGTLMKTAWGLWVSLPQAEQYHFFCPEPRCRRRLR